MSLDLYRRDLADLMDRARANPVQDLPPTFAETLDAAVIENRRFASSDAYLRNRWEHVQDLIDRFHDETGEVLPNPENAQGPQYDQDRIRQYRYVRDRFDAYRQQNPGTSLSFPDEDGVHQGAIERGRQARQDRKELEERPQDFSSAAGFFLGDLWGAVTDPLNIGTMLFGAPAASGILRTALIEGALGTASQAAIEVGTFGTKQEMDPTYTARDAAANIGMAGAGGAVIGGGAVALGKGIRGLAGQARRLADRTGRRDLRDAANVLEREAEIEEANPFRGAGVDGEVAHREASRKAAEDIEAGRAVDVSPIVEEAQRLARAYDEVLAAPHGAPNDPLVELRPTDIERVLVERGPVREKNGEIQVRWKGQKGYGLVKVIWRHGEASSEDPAFRVTRDDVLALPEVIRSFEPALSGSERGNREWRVEREGRTIVYAVAPMPDDPDAARLVTIYAQRPDRAGAERPLSKKRAGAPDSPLETVIPLQDTGQEPYPSFPGGRAAPALADIGVNRGRVYTSAGRPVDVEYRVVEADELVASHGADGSANPAYPADLQPRDRSRVSSQAQIAEIAANLQPERLGRSTDAATGAPIVGPDLAVESGNGRVAAIRRAYEQGGEAAERYRAWVAEQFPEAAGMRNPVLVAQRRTDLDRVAFAREANTATAARMSPTEQAKADAALIDDAVLDRLQSADVGAAANRPAVRAFLDRLPASERAGLVDADGALNQEGRRRMEGALLGRAYGDARTIGRIVEDADTEVKAIGGALLDVAGPWARMRAAAARGELAPGMDVTQDLLAAVRMVAEARASGRKVAELADQTDMFGGELSPVGRLLLGMMFRDEGLKKPIARTKLADALGGYVDEAVKNTAGPRLFGEPLTAEQLLRGDRLAGEPEPSPARPGEARNADEVAALPETDDALFQDLNRLLASRDVEVAVDEMIDPKTKQVVTLRRNALDLLEEADRAIADVEAMAACVFQAAA
jgi:hypothetical protein